MIWALLAFAFFAGGAAMQAQAWRLARRGSAAFEAAIAAHDEAVALAEQANEVSARALAQVQEWRCDA